MQTYLEMDREPIQIYLFPTGKQGKVLSKGRQWWDREREELQKTIGNAL